MTNWKELSHGNFSEAYGSMPVPKDTQRRKKRRRLRRILMFGAILVAAGMVVAFFYRNELRGRYRQAMADYNLDRARTAMLAADWNTAQNHARSVLIARANDPEAGRIRFQALGELNHPQHVQAAYWLFMNPQGNESLLPEALEVALEKGPQALFIRAYASLSPEIRRSNAVRAVLARFLNQRGEFAAALACVRDPEAPEKPSPALRFEESRALIGIRGGAAIQEVRTIFTDLIEASRPPAAGPGRTTPTGNTAARNAPSETDEDELIPLDDPLKRAAEVEATAAGEDAAGRARREAGDAALEMLRLLAWLPDGLADTETLPDLEAWVATQPQATVEHRLLALHQRMHLNAEEAAAIIEAAVKDHVGEDPAAVGEWLDSHGKHEQALLALLAPASTNSDVWVSLIGHLIKLPDLSRARRILENPPSSYDPVIAALLDVLLRRAEGDERGERRAWRNAMEAAGRDNETNRFIEVGSIAASLDAELPAMDAWTAAVRRGDGPLPLYRDFEVIVALLARHGRTQDLNDVTRIMSALEPGDVALRNNSLYLAMLYDSTAVREIIRELDELIEANPEVPQIRSSRAMAALLADKPDEALEWLDALGDAPDANDATRLAIAATAHAIADRPDQARTFLEQVPWGALLPREREIFFRMLSSKAAQDLPLPDLSIFLQPTPESGEEIPDASDSNGDESTPDQNRPEKPGPR